MTLDLVVQHMALDIEDLGLAHPLTTHKTQKKVIKTNLIVLLQQLHPRAVCSKGKAAAEQKPGCNIYYKLA